MRFARGPASTPFQLALRLSAVCRKRSTQPLWWSPGSANANASDALDRHARSSPAVGNTCTHTHVHARPARRHWLPPRRLPASSSAQPATWCCATGSLPFPDWLLAALAVDVDADALLFFLLFFLSPARLKRRSRLSRLWRSRLSPPATRPQPADGSLPSRSSLSLPLLVIFY